MQHHQHIAELGPLLEKLEIRHVIIAPGSRNAPLIQLFTSGESFQCYSVVDERSAGYVALGMARQLQAPVAVLTTSGTAVMNLAPAVAEAFYQQVPMILLTADRPLEEISQFNNQVIDQMAPFYNHSKGFFEFPMEPRSEEELQKALKAAGQLIFTATEKPVGPVHINIPLEEPLYEKLPKPLLAEMDHDTEARFPNQHSPAVAHYSDGEKILMLAGMGDYDEEIQSRLKNLTTSLQIVVVAENIANLQGDQFIANPELILAGASGEEYRKLKPELLMVFGGQVVSKRLKQFVLQLIKEETRIVQADPLSLIEELERHEVTNERDYSNEYLVTWKMIETREKEKAERFLSESPYCNLTAIYLALSSLPEQAVVHLGNSATIRYSQFMSVRQDLRYYSNRGTSGIDGCVSTAVGAALVSNRLHVLLLGDLSFVYDSNALWNQKFPKNLKIIVFNDGGGGIFRLLEGPDRMNFFEEFSVTHHPVSIELLSQSFGRSYQRVCNKEELLDRMSVLYQPESTLSIMEVDTANSENSRIFREFFKQNH